MIKNILITGGDGFIGKNLKEYLGKKYNIFAPKHIELELTNFGAVKEFFETHQIDLVVHCAYKGGVRGILDNQSVIDDNLKMFHNLEACLDGRRMVFFGSGAQYDKSIPLQRVKEELLGKFSPKDPYGYSKLFIAKEIENLDNITCLTIFGCYGKWENEGRFPTYAISQNIKNEPIIINKNVVFDYLYIDDLCKIVEICINKKPAEKIINITPTESISLLEIAKIVNEISDYKSEIIIKDPDLNNEYTGDNARLLSEIKNFQFSSYEYGLRKLYEFLSANIKSLTV